MPEVEVTNTWQNLSFNELGAVKDQKIAELDAYFKSHTKGVGPAAQIDMDADEVNIVRVKNQEITDITKRWEQLREMNEIFKKTVDSHTKNNTPERKAPYIVDYDGDGHRGGSVKSLGEMFTDTNAYKSHRGLHDSGNYEYRATLGETLNAVEMKTLMTTSAGFAPDNGRTAKLVPFALRRPTVGDLIPTDPTTLTTIKYMEETTWGTATTNANPAAAVAEGDAKPEAELEWTEQSAEVEKIAVWIPVTTEQLEDVPGIQGIINNRLSMMLQLKEEDYLLTGTGVSPQIEGFLVKTGVLTQAAGGDTNIDALYRGMTKVRVSGFAEPTAVVVHPNNWTPIRLAKTLDGQYIWGHPSDPGPERIFGKSVIVTQAITANTALTGDFQLYSHISRKKGITVIVGTIGNQLIENKKTIVAEMRESLEIFRASAFCKITGLGTT